MPVWHKLSASEAAKATSTIHPATHSLGGGGKRQEEVGEKGLKEFLYHWNWDWGELVGVNIFFGQGAGRGAGAA